MQQKYPEYDIGRGTYGELIVQKFGDNANLRVGSFTSLGPGTKILLGGEHQLKWVSTFPFDRKYFNDPTAPHSSYSKGDVVIGSDVWIGDGALILSGTTIGDGAVIGARSVVRGHVPPYAIMAGSPARVVRSRFESKIVEQLLEIKWWQWEDEKLRKNLNKLMASDVAAFCAEHGRDSAHSAKN